MLWNGWFCGLDPPCGKRQWRLTHWVIFSISAVESTVGLHTAECYSFWYGFYHSTLRLYVLVIGIIYWTVGNITLNSVRQHNHFITQGNYKVTCFECRLVILRSILSIVSEDAMHTLGSHRVYIHGIHQIKSFVSKGVTCKLCLQQWDT